MVCFKFNSLKIWGITKSKLMGELRTNKIVTAQGNKQIQTDQGWWTEKSKICEYLTEITTLEDLHNFIR